MQGLLIGEYEPLKKRVALTRRGGTKRTGFLLSQGIPGTGFKGSVFQFKIENQRARGFVSAAVEFNLVCFPDGN